jgi:hypothetical protein
MSKSIAKKSTKKAVAVIVKKRKANPLHEKLIKLFVRPTGATLADVVDSGFKYPAIQALRIAERRGYKTSVKKQPGELTCYFARKA